jgi:ribosomal-protein-alanine N-acetyltransferase
MTDLHAMLTRTRRNDDMRYRFVPLRWRDVLAVSRWRYSGHYAFYNSSLLEMADIWLTQAGLRLLGRLVYYSVLDAQGDLVGIFSFTPRGSVIEIGLGMRPDLTGHGAGQEFVESGLAFARERYAPAGFRLDVARWNERARRVYERAGFMPTRILVREVRGTSHEFIEMTRAA